MIGNEVEILIDEEKAAGEYEIQFNASALPSGMYFYELISVEFKSIKKIVLIK